MPIVHQTDEEYHGGEGYSKSFLYKAYTKTPFHARFEKRKETAALLVGKAAHIAILQPELLEQSVTRGPAARGNSNVWKEAQDFANAAGTMLLKPDEHDTVMLIRDLAANVPEIVLMQESEQHTETAAYHTDEATGLLLKTKPDIYSVTHRLIGDVKNMADASWPSFQRDVGKFGYHFQHALYSDVWEKGAELPVDGFFFIVFEKSDPPMVACYELKPSAVKEGYEQYRAAVEMVAACEAKNEWPGYPSGVQRIGLRRYDHKLTPPPEGAEDEDHFEEEAEDEIEDLPEV